VHSLGQCFIHQRSTSGTDLAGVARVNQYHNPTSTLSLVGCVLHQLVPRSIVNRLSKAMVFHHLLDIEVFKSNNPKSLNQLATFLMGKVLPLPGNSLMHFGNNLAAFTSAYGSLFLFRQATLSFLKFFLLFFEKSGVRDQGKRI
jgi:hypothetical protein